MGKGRLMIVGIAADARRLNTAKVAAAQVRLRLLFRMRGMVAGGFSAEAHELDRRIADVSAKMRVAFSDMLADI